jgi:hypothetical protein
MVDSGHGWSGHTDWWQHDRLKVGIHEVKGKILIIRPDGLHAPVPSKYSIRGIEKALRYCPLCKTHDVDTYQFGLTKRQACIPCRFIQVAEILVGEEVKDLLGSRIPCAAEAGKYIFTGVGNIYRVMANMASHGRFQLENVKDGSVISADLHGADGLRYDFHKTIETGGQPLPYEAPEPVVHWKDRWRKVYEEKRTMHDGEVLTC